jgi:hypothetical protein
MCAASDQFDYLSFVVLYLPCNPHRQVVDLPSRVQTTNYTDRTPVHLKVLFPFMLNKFVIFLTDHFCISFSFHSRHCTLMSTIKCKALSLPTLCWKNLFCVDKVICCVTRLHNDMELSATKKRENRKLCLVLRIYSIQN